MMQSFYQSVDVVVVNSISDSWGRIITEAAGLGTPVLIRRGECGADQVLPGAALIPAISDLTTGDFLERLAAARGFAPVAQAYVNENYSAARVRETWLNNLRALTPKEQCCEFDSLVEKNALGDLDHMIFW